MHSPALLLLLNTAVFQSECKRLFDVHDLATWHLQQRCGQRIDSAILEVLWVEHYVTFWNMTNGVGFETHNFAIFLWNVAVGKCKGLWLIVIGRIELAQLFLSNIKGVMIPIYDICLVLLKVIIYHFENLLS